MSDAAPRTPSTTVYVVDDHDQVRTAIVELVEAAPDLSVVGETATLDTALTEIIGLRPDVAVIDQRIGDQSGLALCRQVRAAYPAMACVIVTSVSTGEAGIDAARDAGAAAYVLKQLRPFPLVDAIRRVAAGQTWASIRPD